MTPFDLLHTAGFVARDVWVLFTLGITRSLAATLAMVLR